MQRSGSVALRLSGVTRRYGAVNAVNSIDLDVEPGDFVALVGPSGCGKTTLLRLIGGLERPDSGTIERMPARSSDAISYCFQEPRLLPWRTVCRNVELPLELEGVPARERRERALEAIERMRLSDARDRLPHALSGGMRMRASMARALVTRPRLLLLDEPFGALDEVTRQELDEELRAIWEAERCTTLLVTHSIPEAVFLAERVLVLTPRPARIELDRRNELPPRSAELRFNDAFNQEVRLVSEALHHSMGRVLTRRSGS